MGQSDLKPFSSKSACHSSSLTLSPSSRRIEVPCKVLSCPKPAVVLGVRLCHAHYQKLLRKGSDRDFSGLGVLACRTCGGAYADHPTFPCPVYENERRQDLGLSPLVTAR